MQRLDMSHQPTRRAANVAAHAGPICAAPTRLRLWTLAALIVLGGCGSGNEDSPVQVSAASLFPNFSEEQADYVVRCDRDAVDLLNVPGEAIDVKGGQRQSLPGGVERVFLNEEASLEFQSAGRLYSIRCLPKLFPVIQVVSQAAPAGATDEASLYLGDSPLGGAQQRAVIFDHRGTPVWWRSFGFDPRALKVLGNGTLIGMNTTAGCSPTPGNFSQCATIRMLDLKTGQESTILDRNLALDVHDITPTSSGTLLGIRYVLRDCSQPGANCLLAADSGIPQGAQILDGEIIEFDLTGNIVFRWSSATENLERFFSPRWTTYGAFADLGLIPAGAGDDKVTLLDGSIAHDLLHINSVDMSGDKLLVSARHLDAVFVISKSSGLVEWKLGGKAWGGHSLPLLPTAAFTGTATEALLGGQHDARFLAPNEFTVYDNGTGRSRLPRALRLKLNAGTSASVEEVLSSPNVRTSVCCGSARRNNSGWVVSWGGTNTVGVYAADGSKRLEMAVDLSTASGALGFSYQFVPIAAGAVTKADLRSAMNRQYAAAR